MSNLLRKDAQGTMNWALGIKDSAPAVDGLITWGQMDQTAAAAWLTGNAVSRDWTDDGLKAFAINYFQRSPEDSIAWATRLPPGKVRDTTITSLRKSLANDSGLKNDKRATLNAQLDLKP
jgi:hypothetical protein